MFYEITTKRKSVKATNVLNLNDDWRTQGNWVDCYGNHSAVFCGQGGGGCDFHSGYFLHELKYAGWIGGNYREKDDQLRRWGHWIESNDRRVLQCETLGGRKKADGIILKLKNLLTKKERNNHGKYYD
ncbi:MAG: hypothetical protein LBC74_02600 [Planctomycetaceae bacterium]|jgi:hypothetical protein|nr:hypothetical protein [Planctomycetaceae bacterium]